MRGTTALSDLHTCALSWSPSRNIQEQIKPLSRQDKINSPSPEDLSKLFFFNEMKFFCMLLQPFKVLK